MTREEAIKTLITIDEGHSNPNFVANGHIAMTMAIQALEDIGKISKALSEITDHECCAYGFDEECDLADKYIGDRE